MNAAPALFSQTGNEVAWSAATERVAAYLRAHRLTSAGQVARLTADIIAIARTRARPGAEPMTLAMETVEAGLRSWFAQLLPAAGAESAPLLARGRVALGLGNVPARWPNYFMSGQAAPMELVRQMREGDPVAAPAVKFSNMAPRLFATPEVAGGRLRWQWSYRWPFLRIVTGVAVVLSLLGATLAAGGR